MDPKLTEAALHLLYVVKQSNLHVSTITWFLDWAGMLFLVSVIRDLCLVSFSIVGIVWMLRKEKRPS